MRKFRRYISRNWLLIIIGLVFTAISVKAAYIERGYWAIGGEYFVLPVLLMGAEIVRGIADEISELWG
jgi:hypothetical protein